MQDDIPIGGALLAASRDSVELIDRSGQLVFVSPLACSMLEIDDPASVTKTVWTEAWPPDSREQATGAITRALGGELVRFEAFRPTRRGTPKWWDVSIGPVQGPANVIDRLIVVSRDITQQKAVESSLSTSEQRFRALADNMAQLAWMADAKGHAFWFNQRWTEYTGKDLADMHARGWRQVYHPDFVGQIEARMGRAFQQSEMWEEVLPLRRADGSYRWFLTRAVPVRDELTRATMWCATHTDITEQRNLSQRLRQLARVLELSHEAILVWDFTEGIVLWNNGCEELYGWRRSDALGSISHDLLQTYHPMGLDRFKQHLIEYGEWAGELRHTNRDGREVWVESRQELIRAGGRNLVLETNRDITERRKADALRELLVAELDHRVKNTLAIVQSIATQTARSQTTVDGYLATFSGRVQALGVAQSILSDAHWAGAALGDLVRSQLSMTIGNTERVTLSGGDVFVPPQTAVQLALILHELATNATRHGALSVPEGRVAVTWKVEAGGEKCVVLDWQESNGPSVRPPTARGFGSQLIERTGRLPHIQTVLEFATGGVHCRVKSGLPEDEHSAPLFRPGTLTGIIPGDVESVARRMQARPARLRVLLVEDDPIEILRIEELLAEEGYFVVGPMQSLDDNARGLDQSRYDLAIVDLDAPGFGAEALVAKLRALAVPCVGISNDRARADMLGAGDALVLKPVDSGALREALAALAAQRPD